MLVCFEAERNVREAGHLRSFEGGQDGQGCECVQGGVSGGRGGTSLPQGTGWPAHPGWALLPWSSPMASRGAWSWGLLTGPGEGPGWKTGGLGQRHGSEAPCFVT